MTDSNQGRGAASCGVHRFADAHSMERFEAGHRMGPHPCPWCRINRLMEEMADLRARLGLTPPLGPLTTIPEVEVHGNGKSYLRTLNASGGWDFQLLDDDGNPVPPPKSTL